MPDVSFYFESLGNVRLLRCRGLESRHAFSTRAGGVSDGAFGSLNLGLSSGDERERVLTNRERFVLAAGFSGPVYVGHQIHGALVNEAPFEPGTKGDVVVTHQSKTPIGVFVADCVPILIEDRQTGAVAAVHAGWRGTAQQAVTAAIQSLSIQYGGDPKDMVAAIGPSIKGCCYQVGEEVVEALAHLPDRDACVRRQDGASYVDLQEANRQMLIAAGIGAVHVSGLCTACDPDRFFSYRRDGERSGRMLAAIEV